MSKYPVGKLVKVRQRAENGQTQEFWGVVAARNDEITIPVRLLLIQDRVDNYLTDAIIDSVSTPDLEYMIRLAEIHQKLARRAAKAEEAQLRMCHECQDSPYNLPCLNCGGGNAANSGPCKPDCPCEVARHSY